MKWLMAANKTLKLDRHGMEEFHENAGNGVLELYLADQQVFRQVDNGAS